MKCKSVPIAAQPEDHLRLHRGDRRVIDGIEMRFHQYLHGPQGVRELWVTPSVDELRREQTKILTKKYNKLKSASKIVNRAMNRMEFVGASAREKRIAFHITRGRSVADIVIREGWPASMVSEIYKKIIDSGNSYSEDAQQPTTP